MDKNRNATIGDVAQEAGVSVATVSRVVNGNYPVREVTRQRVEAAIERLRYVPNVQARELNTQTSSVIGVVAPSLYNMFFAEVIGGIEEGMRSRGMTLILSCAQNDPGQERDCVTMLVTRNVAGIIVISPNTEDIEASFYRDLARRVPLVFINGYQRIGGISYVMNDEAEGTRKALHHLYGLGHREILFVEGVRSDSYRVKEEAYRAFCRAEGLHPRILDIGEGNNVETVRLTAERAQTFLEEDRTGAAVTAAVCCNDLMATGVIRAARTLGLAVPGDFSVTGFDNVVLSRLIEPPITTLDQNMAMLGTRAAEILGAVIDGGKPQSVMLENSLIVRGTTGEAREARRDFDSRKSRAEM